MLASAALRSPLALLRHEAAPGVILFLSAILALVPEVWRELAAGEPA